MAKTSGVFPSLSNATMMYYIVQKLASIQLILWLMFEQESGWFKEPCLDWQVFSAVDAPVRGHGLTFEFKFKLQIQFWIWEFFSPRQCIKGGKASFYHHWLLRYSLECIGKLEWIFQREKASMLKAKGRMKSLWKTDPYCASIPELWFVALSSRLRTN